MTIRYHRLPEHEWPVNLDQGIHVWHLRGGKDYYSDNMMELLDEGERNRANRFHAKRDHFRFVCFHYAVRRILTHYTGLSPEKIQFGKEANGKPHLLVSGVEERPCHFNLSHSGDLGLLAISQDQEIGVDVEQMHALNDLEGVAERVFNAEERTWMNVEEGVKRQERFFTLWTRKEAVVKNLGLGIFADLPSYSVHGNGAVKVVLPEAVTETKLTVLSMDDVANAKTALACAHLPDEITLCQFDQAYHGCQRG